MTTEFKDRLRSAREKAGFASAAEAAEALGVKVPTYTHHENGTRGPKRDAVERYAQFFGVDVSWLLFGKRRAGPTEPSKAVFDIGRAKRLLEPARIPLLGDLEGFGDYIVASAPELDMVEAPAKLLSTPGAYALRMPGTSMEPRYHDGETLFVCPKMAKPGQYVVVHYATDQDAQELVLQVARYERVEGENRIFSRYNGPDLAIPNDRIKAIHEIIATGSW